MFVIMINKTDYHIHVTSVYCKELLATERLKRLVHVTLFLLMQSKGCACVHVHSVL